MQLRITPKRKRKLLNPKNVATWVGCFVRRGAGGESIPIDLCIDRYLEDTGAALLRDDPTSVASLREEIVAAMRKIWDIEIDGDGIVRDAQLLPLVRQGGKFVFTIPAKTILNMGSGFNDKDLASRGTASTGSACTYSCTYCSVGASMFRSPHTRILRLLNIKHGDAVIRRLEPSMTLRDQLTFRNGTPRYQLERGVVFLSPIVDPLPSIDLLEETLELVLIVMELTNWDVRILTKSMLVKKLAKRIPVKYRRRIIYGLSIGILDEEVGKAVEKLTSPPSKRLEAYRELQAAGLRTYSMHCPIFPQDDYTAYAEQLAASVDWESDEFVWPEALNSRGESNQKTIDALRGSEFNAEADLLAKVTRSHCAWEFEYNRSLFAALAAVCPPGKLRYLVYPGDADRDYWLSQQHRGAVVLGKDSTLHD